MSERDVDDAPLPEELDRADELLEKAEALIRKHQGEAGRDAIDDLPVLTDVVELPSSELPAAGVEAPLADQAVVERLIELDSVLSLAIESWVADELPQIMSREFDAMNERVREQALAHLRATLKPELSNEIAELLALMHPKAD